MSCLYYHCAEDGKILYIGKSVNLHSRTTSHAHGAPWWDEVAFIYVEHIPKDINLDEAEQFRIASMEPVHNKLRYGKAVNSTKDSALKIGFNYGYQRDVAAFRKALYIVAAMTSPEDWEREAIDYSYRQKMLFDLMTLQIHSLRREIVALKKRQDREDAADHSAWEGWLSAQGKIMFIISRLIEDLDMDTKWDGEIRTRWLRNQLFDATSAIKDVLSGIGNRIDSRVVKTPTSYGKWIWERAFDLIHMNQSSEEYPPLAERQEVLNAKQRSAGWHGLETD